MRGLMMGRFQPFHLGHLDLVKQILKECDEIIIALTGLQFNYIEKDPFTSGERIEMIHQSFKENNIDLNRCYIIAVENQFNVATWPSYLKSSLPHFDKVYSGNDYVKMLLGDFGYNVTSPKFLERTRYNGTIIRQMIGQDKEWESLVPSSVSKIIKRINGVQRIKTILKTDTKPQEF
ncbi:MAG TPA: nicotinamide-nucleotide adenylyltransferase [Nitrosopumilaceae archaeon]|nr:nicotinamide-nucleotide adenylyltransferase [Nitrosopumilaceae archaeon]